MTPIPNGSTPSAEPQGRNPEQTTGAAVGGVSATIPDDVNVAPPGIDQNAWDDAVETMNRTGWFARSIRVACARAIMSAKAEQRDADARSLEKLSDQTIRLHCGELSAQEMRAVRAFVAWQAYSIRKGA